MEVRKIGFIPHFVLAFNLLLLCGCIYAQNVYVNDYVERDRETDLTPPLTNKESVERYLESKNRRLEKTCFKKIPFVCVYNSESDSLILTELIQKNTYIGFADFRCGFGLEHLEDVFPEMLECAYYSENYDFILLVAVDSPEYLNSKEFFQKKDFWFRNYRDFLHVYFIESDEAKNLNLFSFPSHLICDETGFITDYQTGLKEIGYWREWLDLSDL